MVDQKNNNNICPVRSVQEGKDVGHWWVIEGQHGETSTGKCKDCGVTSEFVNSNSGGEIFRHRRNGHVAQKKKRQSKKMGRTW